MSGDGYRMDPGCVQAIEKLREVIPKTVGEVRQLAGILSYYRRYIKNFARTAKPIYDLLTATGKDGQPPSKTPIHWGREKQLALEELVEHLSNPPVMTYPDFSKAFTLHTDASKDGLGAVLYKTRMESRESLLMLHEHCHQLKRNTTFMQENLSFWP